MFRTYLIYVAAACAMHGYAAPQYVSASAMRQAVAESAADCLQASITWLSCKATSKESLSNTDLVSVAELQQVCFDLLEQIIDDSSDWYCARRSDLDHAAQVAIDSMALCKQQLAQVQLDKQLIHQQIKLVRDASAQLKPHKRESKKSAKVKQLD